MEGTSLGLTNEIRWVFSFSKVRPHAFATISAKSVEGSVAIISCNASRPHQKRLPHPVRCLPHHTALKPPPIKTTPQLCARHKKILLTLDSKTQNSITSCAMEVYSGTAIFQEPPSGSTASDLPDTFSVIAFGFFPSG